MSSGERFNKTLNNLETVLHDFRTYAQDTSNTGAKQMFSNYAQQLENMAQGLKVKANDLDKNPGK